MKIELVNYTEDFLSYSWRWLNDPEIKRLTNTQKFSKEDQIKWFLSLNNRPDYKIWGIDADNNHIGVCGLKNITNVDCEYWGYIGEKNYWGKGIGRLIVNYLIEYARNIGLKSVWLTVLPNNERAIGLYVQVGFTVESEENKDLTKMRINI